MDMDSLIIQMRNDYLVDLDEKFAEIEQLILAVRSEDGQKENYCRLMRHIHSIKGCAGSIGLGFLTTACHNFEDCFSVSPDKIDDELVDMGLKLLDLKKEYAAEMQFRGEADSSLYVSKLREIQNNKADVKCASRALVVETANTMRSLYVAILKELNIDFSFASDGLEALGRILRERFSCVLVSLHSPTISGVSLAKIAKEITEVDYDCKFIVVTGDKNFKNPGNIDYLVTKSPEMSRELMGILKSIARVK